MESTNGPNHWIGWIEDPKIRAAAIRALIDRRTAATIEYSNITRNFANRKADAVIKEKLQQIEQKASNDKAIANVKFKDSTPSVSEPNYSVPSSMVADIDAKVLREYELNESRKQFEELKQRREQAILTARENAIKRTEELKQKLVTERYRAYEKLVVNTAIVELERLKEQYEIQKRNVALYSELDEPSYAEGVISSNLNNETNRVAQEVYDFLEKMRRGYAFKVSSLAQYLPFNQNNPQIQQAMQERDRGINMVTVEKEKFEAFLAEAKRYPETFKRRITDYARDLFDKFNSKYYDFESMTGEEIEEYNRQRTQNGTITRVVYPGKTDALGRAIKPAVTAKESQNMINYNGLGTTAGPEGGGQANPSFYGWFGVVFGSPRAFNIGYLGSLCASENGVQRDMPVALWRTSSAGTELLSSVVINPGDTDTYYDGTYIFKKIPPITVNSQYSYIAAVYYRSVLQDPRQNDRYQYGFTEDLVNIGRLSDGDANYIKVGPVEIPGGDITPQAVSWYDNPYYRDFTNYAAETLGMPAGNVGFRNDGFFAGKPRESFVYRQGRINPA